ncbi:MAG: alpha/beta hydrolase [Synechococcales cyanobacterium RM1_1_8]|nr:alpha/beta hydrolase [Synechococcales cyanobacterium RM1_1_8]
MPTVEIRGTSHFYELTAPVGSPQVLVFVHGWLLSRSYWQPLIQQLSPQCQCLSYDLRGFGASSQVPRETTPQPYDPAAYAEDLGQLLDHLQIESAWLVGHSLGGTIALWGAKLLPGRVRGVTCINAGGGVYLQQEFERFRSVGRSLVQWRHPLLGKLPLDWMFAKAGTVQPMAQGWRRQRLVDYLAAHGPAALGALLESTTQEQVHRLPSLVAQLPQPVYFLAGDQDPIMPPRYVRHLASFHGLFRESCGESLTELRDCGHMAMVEQTEAVARRLGEILAAHPAPVKV